MSIFPKALPHTCRSYQIDGYTVEVSTTSSIEYLKQDWLRLEGNRNIPVFLSWHWMACWVKTYCPQIIVITAKYKSQIVSIGFFTSSLNTRNVLIRSKQLRLHQTGEESKDQVWIEYNDFISDESHRDNAVNACLQTLFRPEFVWDEIVLSMMLVSRAKNIILSLPQAKIDMRSPGYAVDLSEIRDKGLNYIETLNSNTRYQIRRSIRRYSEKYGELTLYRAVTKVEAINLFFLAGKYHTMRWADSGFNNPQFVQFHKNIIRDSFEDGSIQLIRINAGEETIAILYYHIVKSQVFFYLQGIQYHSDKKLKPGLVAHVLATDFFLQEGMDYYDYMGGYSQYKTQLAGQTEDLATVVIQRPRSQFRLENMARNIKSRIISAEK